MRLGNRLNLLNLAATLTIAGSAVSGVLQLDRILLRWQVILLLLFFALLYSRYPDPDGTPHVRHTANLLIGFQALLAAYLIWVTGLSFSFLVLIFILSASAALYNPLRVTLAWIAAFTALTALLLFQLGGWTGILREMAVYTGGYLFFGFITNALSATRQAQAQNERLLAELQATNARLEEYARQVETLAAVQERNRLAREVHDTLGHRLTSSAVQLEAAQRLSASNPEKAAQLIATVRQQVREALQELRQTVGRLREPLEIELSLPQALRRLAENFQSASELAIHLEVPEQPCQISAAQKLALYRAAQEGLTNIQRHAQATQAWLRLTCRPGGLRLEIQDNGIGMGNGSPPDQGGFGLRGLQERAAALGGAVQMGANPGGGTLLTMDLPNTNMPA
jgi:signal transduction histidine kinase